MIRRCFSARVQLTRLKQPAAGYPLPVVLTNQFNKKAGKSYVEFYELLLFLIVEQGVVETLINEPSLRLEIVLYEINFSNGISKFIFDLGVHRPQFDPKKSILSTLATPAFNGVVIAMWLFWVDFRLTNALLLHALSMRYNISMELVFLLQQKSILAAMFSTPPLPRPAIFLTITTSSLGNRLKIMSLRYSQGFWWMCSSSSQNDVAGQWNSLGTIPYVIAKLRQQQGSVHLKINSTTTFLISNEACNWTAACPKYLHHPLMCFHRPQFDPKKSILSTLATPAFNGVVIAIFRYEWQLFWVDFRLTNALLLHTLSMMYNISMELVFLLQQKSILAAMFSTPPLSRKRDDTMESTSYAIFLCTRHNVAGNFSYNHDIVPGKSAQDNVLALFSRFLVDVLFVQSKWLAEVLLREDVL
ncbi:hypothetical protein T07_10511 [Trichinella nelsoni]|uniref:Uncharacterized protein n=1 Tax=Trichinella nelsoni TaxID=6336 RepID=A0A0V0RJ88_9BILA|nr:hypothetical protein T07_10511 [Trichinella nelsoni]